MKFLNLICNLMFILLLKNVLCSKSDDKTGPQDSDELNEKQDLSEKMEMPNLNENDALKKIIENENFLTFSNLMMKAHQMFMELEEKDIKNELTFHNDVRQRLKTLTSETLITSNSLNREIYKSYLDKTIKLIDEFIPLFENKKDKEIAMRLPKLIRNIVQEFGVIRSLLPNIIKLYNEKSTKLKPSDFDSIREIFILLEKQIGELQQEFERYWNESNNWIAFYNKENIQPSKLKSLLEKVRAKIPSLKKERVRDQALFCNKSVIICFRHFSATTKIEKKLFNSVHSYFLSICETKKNVDLLLESYKN